MRKNFIKILLCAAFSLVLAGCPGKNNSSPTSSIFSSDETNDAGNLVDEVNRDYLKKIKERFKNNETRLDDLQAALKGKNPEKVKEISQTFVDEIDAGTQVGEEAINKLRLAREKNINDDYKDYLDLKIQALEKYVDAFEERRQAAILLRDGYDPKNAARREQTIAAFKQREDKFKSIVEEARKLSEDANRLARESLNRKK